MFSGTVRICSAQNFNLQGLNNISKHFHWIKASRIILEVITFL